MPRQKITTFLWFDNNAEEAVDFYVSTFKNSKILNVTRYSEAGPGPAGSVMIMEFQLGGVDFIALNGGPQFKFTEAISLSVDCSTQAEVDELWTKLTEGGQEIQCGWLKDKYGLSWQIVPAALGEMMADPDLSKRKRVFEAMMRMVKLVIEKLRQAYYGQ